VGGRQATRRRSALETTSEPGSRSPCPATVVLSGYASVLYDHDLYPAW
jgi:hypothetical protein